MPATKSIYLTFDDGPNEPYTSEILACLEGFGARATFFVCGKNVERDPESLRRISESGNAIGNHAYSHSWLKTHSAGLFGEFMVTGEIIRTVTGEQPTLARAPWGLMAKKVARALGERGYRICTWDISAYDWWQPSPAYIARSVIRQAFDGCVVLLHDGQKTKAGKSRAHTVAAVRMLIPRLQEQGYEFKPLA